MNAISNTQLLLRQERSAVGSSPISSYHYDRSDAYDYRDVARDVTDHTGQIDRVGYDSGSDDCCTLVVDPLTWLAGLLMIGVGTLCLNTYITRNSAAILMAATGGKRRRRGLSELDSPKNKFADVFWHGELILKCPHFRTLGTLKW